MKQFDGYYWVKYDKDSEWGIAELIDDTWFFIGTDRPHNIRDQGEDLYEIGEEIKKS